METFTYDVPQIFWYFDPLALVSICYWFTEFMQPTADIICVCSMTVMITQYSPPPRSWPSSPWPRAWGRWSRSRGWWSWRGGTRWSWTRPRPWRCCSPAPARGPGCPWQIGGHTFAYDLFPNDILFPLKVSLSGIIKMGNHHNMYRVARLLFEHNLLLT